MSGQETFAAFDPDWTVPPGEMLQEALEEAGMTVVGLSGATGLPRERAAALIAAEVELTEDDATLLERGTGIPARLWLRMEANYRDDLAAGRTWFGRPAVG